MRKILFIAFLISTSTVFPQTKQQPLYCGFDYFIQKQRQHNAEYITAYEDVLRNWKADAKPKSGGGGVYTIPVVFHIVYHDDEQNIADSVVHSQMEVLNEDYRRMNADAVNTRDIFLPFAADCEIEFELASVDPDGNSTTGITHNYTDETGFSLDIFSAENTLDYVKHSETGGVDAWDTEHYLNVWVCNIEASLFGQIFGLSYPPAGLDNWPAGSNAPTPDDAGVVVHYTTVGRNNPFADEDGTDDNNLGRTCTHEVGHYLGLRHTWGDELFFDECSEDDGMDDTPLCGLGDQYQCNYDANTCNEGVDDLPDQLENYMDYTTDECYNMFTQDQKSLMRYVIEELRPGLLEGVGLQELQRTEAQFLLTPNPTTGNVLLQFTSPASGTVTLYDAAGRDCSWFMLNNSIQLSFDFSEYNPGFYLLQYCSNDGMISQQQLIIAK